jgi:hypothetical protein
MCVYLASVFVSDEALRLGSGAGGYIGSALAADGRGEESCTLRGAIGTNGASHGDVHLTSLARPVPGIAVVGLAL